MVLRLRLAVLRPKGVIREVCRGWRLLAGNRADALIFDDVVSLLY